MKLLITNDELDEIRGGTQVFVADAAKEMRQRGHQVAVYSWLRGSLADELVQAGVPVVASPRDCGFIPDIIHAQHHLAAMTAITAFPGVPAVYHCHGYSPWQERPPVHPRIVRYIGMAQAMVNWMASVTGRKAEEIIVLQNSVHLGRFHRVRVPRNKPERALLFGNAFVPGEHISRLRRACERCGITLEFAGEPFGNATTTPEEILPDYDIVFAIGRSALEAMASGCAVVPFSAAGCGPLLRPEMLDAWGGRNFTVPERTFPVEFKAIMQKIKMFDPGAATAVTLAIRNTASFERTCEKLESLYQETINSLADRPLPTPEDESLALSAYVGGLGPYIKGADERLATLRLQREKSKERLRRLKHRLIKLEAKWDIIEKRLPGFIRRWLLRGID
ncbi:MAG: hypothetical protein WCN98_11190 [Verrucomicrobiaceae bacterium]